MQMMSLKDSESLSNTGKYETCDKYCDEKDNLIDNGELFLNKSLNAKVLDICLKELKQVVVRDIQNKTSKQLQVMVQEGNVKSINLLVNNSTVSFDENDETDLRTEIEADSVHPSNVIPFPEENPKIKADTEHIIHPPLSIRDISYDGDGIIKIDIDSYSRIFDDPLISKLDEDNSIFFVKLEGNGKQKLSDEDFSSLSDKINRPIIFQYKIPGTSILYTKEKKDGPFTAVNLNGGGETTSGEFQKKLEYEKDFGIALLVQGLKSQIVGKFDDIDRRSMLNVQFNSDQMSSKSCNLIDYALKYDNTLLVRYLSRFKWDLSKLKECQKSLTLTSIGIAVTKSRIETICALFNVALDGTVDENVWKKKDLIALLNETCDDYGNTPLILSAHNKDYDKLSLFLNIGVDVNINNKFERRAVDFTWENKNYSSVLKLLKADSKMPDDIQEVLGKEDADAVELQDFLLDRDKLHQEIKDGNLEQVKKLIHKHPSQVHLNRCNASALYTAFINNHLEICAYLFLNVAKFSKFSYIDEEVEFEMSVNIEEFEDMTKKLCVEMENVHLEKLIEKSRVPEDSSNAKEIIKDYYNKLNNSLSISTILKVLQYSKLMEIVYYFKAENIEGMYHEGNRCTKGITDYKKGIITIAAKECDKEGRTKDEILGTLAHELTHYAMFFLYNNGSKPYRKGGNEIEFEKICDETLCKHFALSEKEGEVTDIKTIRQKIMEKFQRMEGITQERLENIESKLNDLINSCDLDGIIRKVFFLDIYPIENRHLELIVRIPHILAEYGDQKGMETLEKQVPGLLEYYKNRVLNDCDKYLTAISSSYDAKTISEMNDREGEINKIIRGKIRLREPFVCEPKIHHYKNTFSLVKSSCLHLCAVYFYQLLSKKYDILLQLRCLFLQMKDYLSSDENKRNFLNILKSEACEQVVLIADSECDLESVFRDLKGIKNKVILIVNDNHPYECDISNFTWNSLEASSREYLKNKVFKFNHKETSLKKMFGDELEKELLDEAALAWPIEEGRVTIPEERDYKCENQICYIERYLRRQTIMSDILKEGYNSFLTDEEASKMLLFISNASKSALLSLGASEAELQNYTIDSSTKKKKRILFSGDDSEESVKKIVDNICEKVGEDKTVHWLQLQDCHLIWKYSNRGFLELKKYVNKDMPIKYKDISEFFRGGEEKKIIILADSPGMGKSTVVSRISYVNQTNQLGYWVLRFNPFNYLPHLKKIDFDDNDKDKGIDLVTDMCNFNNPFEKFIFKLSCKLSNKVVIFFDGFDEISKDWRKKLVILVKALKKSNVFQVWIVTRFYAKEDLENELEVLAYTLNPWEKELQKKFMTEFCKKKHYSESIELSKSLLEELNKSLGDEKGKFTDVPLHCFMLAEAAYSSNFEVNDLDDLYEFFVDAKFKIFHKKKRLEEENHNVIRTVINAAVKTAYRIEAMEAFLKDEEYFPKEHFLKNVDDYKELMTQIGLTISCVDGLKFIHKTFEDYFFTDAVMRNANRIDIQRILLSKILLDDNYSFVRKLLNCKIGKNMNRVQFDRELSKDTDILKSAHFHQFAYEGLDSILELIFKKFPEKAVKVIFDSDEAGENILHCACKNNSNSVIKKILDFFVNTKEKHYMKRLISKRNLCYMRPLAYAVRNDNVKIVELLFKHAKSNFDDDEWILKNMLLHAEKSGKLRKIQDSALHFAILHGRKEVFEYLWLEFKMDKAFLNKVADAVTIERNTILHLSVYSSCFVYMKDLLIHFKNNLSDDKFKKLLLSLNSTSYTFFDVAVLKDNIDVLDVLKECYESQILNQEFFQSFLLGEHNKRRGTVLHHAAYRSHSDVLDKLLDFAKYVFDEDSYKEFLFLCNHKGYTFVHKAVLYCTSDFFYSACESIRKSMEDTFVQLLKVPNKYGNTILHSVAHRGDREIAEKVCELLSNQISDDFILKTDGDGDTFLHKASIKGNAEVLEYMTKFFEPELSSKTYFQELINKPNKHGNRFWDLAKKVLNEERAREVLKIAKEICNDQSLE